MFVILRYQCLEVNILCNCFKRGVLCFCDLPSLYRVTLKCSRRSNCKIKLKLGMLELRKYSVFKPGKELKIFILFPVVVNSSVKLSVSPKLSLMGPTFYEYKTALSKLN